MIVTGIDEAGRDTVMSNLESKGIKAHFYKCDATSEEQVNETFAKIAEKFDHLDLLVNNVGAWAAGSGFPRWRLALCAK